MYFLLPDVFDAGTRSEELPKLLASRRAHKAHLTTLRHKIDETAEGTITHNEIALLKSLVDQLRQKKQNLKELNDKIAVLLETPESLIVEKVFVTDNLIELAKRNLSSQHVLCNSPENINIPSSSPQKGQSTTRFIYVANGTRKSTIQSTPVDWNVRYRFSR